MKKYLCVILTSLLVLSLTGCGSSADTAAPAEEPAVYADPAESIISEESESAAEYADGDTNFGRLPEDDLAPSDEMEGEESGEAAEELESEIIDDIHCRIEDNSFGYIAVYISGTGTIHEEDFEDYSYIPAKVVVEEGISGIGDDVFSGCINLETVILPEGLKSIGDNAFAGCLNLESVTLPESLESVGKSAFAGCQEKLLDKLQGISNSESDIHLRVDGDTLYLSGSGTVQKGDFGEYKPINVVVEKGITGIGEFTFNNYKSLISVTLPEGVEYIGTGAFRDCSNLMSITLPEGLKSIGGSAFYGCKGLTSITLPDSVVTIGSWAFCMCNNLTLTSETLPVSLKSIGEKAFSSCSGLTEATVGRGVEELGENVFNSNPTLTKIRIPKSMQDELIRSGTDVSLVEWY